MARLFNTLLFSVKRSKPQLIVPKTSHLPELKPLSDIDDQGILRVHVPILMFYKNDVRMRGSDPVMVIQQGLAKALAFYYPLAGRIFEVENRKLIVNCNGKGVLFVEAKANIQLERLGYESMQPPCPYLKYLLYKVPGSEGIIDSPLLQIQVTRFCCGGFVLGIRFNHTMMDAQGFMQFLNAVSELGQGASTPSILPVWQRGILSARSTPLITCIHNEFKELNMSWTKTRWGDFDKMIHNSKFINIEKLVSDPYILFGNNVVHDLMVKRSFTFSSIYLQAIKDKCPTSTTFEALSACLWKCRTIALGSDPDAEVRLTFIVNVRARLQDNKVPSGYYGNAFVTTAVVTTTKLLCSNHISYAAKLIREAKNAINDEYVKSMIDLMLLKGRPNVSFVRNFLISDNSRFGFDGVDFGWGKPIFGGVSSATYGVWFLVPMMEDQKGILVALALPPIAMGRFQNELKKVTHA